MTSFNDIHDYSNLPCKPSDYILEAEKVKEPTKWQVYDSNRW